MRSTSHHGVKSPVPQGDQEQRKLSIRKTQLWLRLQAAGEPRAALSRVLPAVSRGPHPSGSSVVPTLTSPTNPRETWGELTRHVRADDVQAHRDGLVDLGKKEQCVAQPLRGSLRVHSLAPGPSPSPPWALALHPIPPLPAGSPRASPRRSVLWETIPGCYWNVSHNQRPSV